MSKRVFMEEDFARPMMKRSTLVPSASRGRFYKNRIQSRIPGSLITARKGEEIKSVDISPSAKIVSTTALFSLLNGTQEGSSFYNRVGRRVTMKSLLIQGYFYPNGNATANATAYCRIMVVYDRQPNGAFPTLADVLTSYTDAGATSSTAQDQLNMNNRDRFRVLRDARVILPPLGAAGVSGVPLNETFEMNGTEQDRTLNVKWFIKLRDLETHYKASSNPAVVGDIATGAVFFMIVQDTVISANAGWTFALQSRLRYTDA
jgi:hypothetical protein